MISKSLTSRSGIYATGRLADCTALPHLLYGLGAIPVPQGVGQFGGFLRLPSLTGWVSLIIAVVGGMLLRQLNKIKSLPMPRPRLDD